MRKFSEGDRVVYVGGRAHHKPEQIGSVGTVNRRGDAGRSVVDFDWGAAHPRLHAYNENLQKIVASDEDEDMEDARQRIVRALKQR